MINVNFKSNNSIITNKRKIANGFNEYFTNVYNNNNGLYLTRINTCVSAQAYLTWSSEGSISTVHC